MFVEIIRCIRERGELALALRGGTHVATVAEVEVSRSTGAVRVKRLTCAHDCGLIVNPDGLRGTISANLIQSMSRVLKEEVTLTATMSPVWTGSGIVLPRRQTFRRSISS